MTFAAYLKGAVWEFVLSCLAATALLYTLLNGFYVDPSLQYGPVPAIACVASMAALYAVAYNKMTLRVGVPAYAVAAVAVLAASLAATPDILADDESNLLLFALCCILTPLVTFALARTRTAAALLFILGVFIIAFIQFFYERYELAWSLLFTFSSLALVVYKNYRRSVETARSVKGVAFLPGFVAAAASVLASLGLGCAVWFGIIAPMNPPALDIKLITEEHALETQQVRGVASMFLVPNLDMTSSRTNDEERTTDDLKLVDDGRIVLANGEDAGDPEDQAGSSFMGIDLDSLRDVFDYHSYEPNDWMRIAAIAAAIVLVAVAYFVGRRMWRAHRLSKIRQGDPAHQVEQLYLFLMDRFERIGFKMPAGQTIAEYASSTATERSRFDEGAGVTFERLTDVYSGLAFGGGDDVTQGAADDFAAYYRSFWKSCRAHLGPVRYFLKSFRL